jgi:DNA-binding CsgD family transcriptional regulator
LIIDDENYLAHYGILRKSGRYPWGSGKTQGERNKSFLDTVDGMRKSGMSEAEIARGFGMSTSQLRNLKSIAKNSQKQADINMAERLKKKGYSNIAIGERMGRPESSVRLLLEPGQKERADVLKATSDMLKHQIDEKHYIDIGSGVEQHLGISNSKLKIAVAKLQEDGYTVHYIPVEQLGTGKNTTVKVLAAPKTPYAEVYRNRDQIKQISGYSEDGGKSYNRILPPLSVSSSRIAVRYAKDGGAAADGVIFVRPGRKDLSLGGSSYAQVRVAVDGTHYLKGMAVYKDDLPHGVDLMFNTNKHDTGNKLDAMKKMKDDPDSPFGSFINHQIQETGAGGKKHVTSAMNLVNEEGDWEKWSSTLSSQMLSKQSTALAKSQLGMVAERKTNELAELRNLSNPAVKKKLLEAYADDADSSAIHLKAAALPRQGTHVILPVSSIKEHEIYAPNYRDGERVALIRHPHGGTFEIPELTVNNRNPEAKKLLGNAKDAVGIHHKVAEKLSGADFDGDTVLVIPNNQGKVKSTPALEGLKGFDPKAAYPAYPGMTRMSSRNTQMEMGKVTNLITDMTIRGANTTELARAVRHSMVVIDAEKHNLDYKQSAIDNGIAQLKQKYQSRPGRSGYGASTVISNSGTTSTTRVPERKQGFKIDPVTGKKIHTETGASYVDAKTGKTVTKTTEVAKLSTVDDAHVFSSGKPIERVYADHSNKMKALANAARKEAAATRSIAYSPAAKVAHAAEVTSLNAKLNLALRNSPLERQAQIIANSVVTQKLHANPGMEKSEIKKLKAQALETARARTGAKKQRIEITDAEWKAIQAGAITNSKLHQILNHADLDQVKKLATPKTAQSMSTARKNQAINMLRNGHTQAEVADALGVSVTTLKRSLSGGDE